MNRCEKCGSEMKPLFTSFFCDCEEKKDVIAPSGYVYIAVNNSYINRHRNTVSGGWFAYESIDDMKKSLWWTANEKIIFAVPRKWAVINEDGRRIVWLNERRLSDLMEVAI